jgi:serine/threonine-protein kinase HipA
MSETLEVWIDAASVGELTGVGRIAHDRGHVRFQYDRAWLTHPRCFDIDPDLSLDQATFHPDPALGYFGIFLDSSPDRWVANGWSGKNCVLDHATILINRFI